MKVGTEDLRRSETKQIEISQFFTVKEKVYMKIRRYSNAQQNELIGIMATGQEIKAAGPSKEQMIKMGGDWYPEYRKKQVLYGVDSKDEEFPFEKWTIPFIDELDEINPDLIAYIQQEVESFNTPLAVGNEEK